MKETEDRWMRQLMRIYKLMRQANNDFSLHFFFVCRSIILYNNVSIFLNFFGYLHFLPFVLPWYSAYLTTFPFDG